ncbi:MAG: hypothetical protein VSS52_003120 [Thiotrichaceae bacterium]|nr:hypothetical protein [Thiotrichaceae bacterium]
MSKIEHSIKFIINKNSSQSDKQHYSLSEINLSEEEYENLKQQIENNLSLSKFKYWSRHWITYEEHPRSALLGYLLLLLISETVRRYGFEGRPWSAARKIQFQEPVDKKLFQYKQPSEQLKDLIKQAATHFNLRHVFDIEGKQEWAGSIFLQLGFTYSGSKRHLATWLSAEEQRPQTVQLLLNGTMASESFQKLWAILIQYRRGNIPRNRAVTVLQQSPWVLNDWIDDILEAATQKIKNISSSEQAGFQHNEITHILKQLLSKPKLIWNKQPYFVISFENLRTVDLINDEYTLIVNTGEQVRFLKKDGYYEPSQSEILIKPAQFQSELLFTLLSDDETEIETYSMSLWDAEDEITLFDVNTGYAISQKTIDNNKEYLLLVSVDLEIIPQPAIFYRLPTYINKILYRLVPVWEQISIPAIGWQSQYIDDKKEGNLYANQILIHLQKSIHREPAPEKSANPQNIFNLGDTVQFCLDIKNPDIEVVAVRVTGNPVDFEDKIITIRLDPENLISNQNTQLYEIRFKIVCRNHEQQYVTIKKSSIPLKIQGVAKKTNFGWQILDSNQILTCQQAKTIQVKFFAISGDKKPFIPIQDYKNYGLIEGYDWITRVWQRPRLIGKLSGLGQALTVRYGPYNGQEETLCLAQTVVDNGIIQKIEINDELIEITLHYPREFTQTTDKIILWYIDEIVVLEDVDCEENKWFLLEEHDKKLLALGIFYEGICLGSYWQQDWLGLLAQSQLDTAQLASLLIWFKLPILQQEAIEILKPKILANPVLFLEYWVLNNSYRLEAFDEVLSWDKKEVGITLIKHFFDKWQPEPQHINMMIDRMIMLYEIENNPLDIQNLLFKLFNFSPVLAMRFFKIYIEFNQFKNIEIRQLISIFKTAKRKSYPETLKYFCEQMQLDETFVEKAVLNPVLDSFQNKDTSNKPVGYDANLSLLLNSTGFQELLLLSLLIKIEKDYE